MPISLNLENYSIKEGSGKNTIKDVNGLCEMCSIPQLSRFADNYLGKRFKKGTKKLEACDLLFTAFQKALADGAGPDDKFEKGQSTNLPNKSVDSRPDTRAVANKPGTAVATKLPEPAASSDEPTKNPRPSRNKTTPTSVPIENKGGLQLITAIEMVASLLGEKIKVSRDGTFNGLITISCTNSRVKVNGQFFPGGEKKLTSNI